MPRDPSACVYLLASRRNGTLFLGVSRNLVDRVDRLRAAPVAGRPRHRVLVWYEVHGTLASARRREQQLKGCERRRKRALIEAQNPAWSDLAPRLLADGRAGRARSTSQRTPRSSATPASGPPAGEIPAAASPAGPAPPRQPLPS